MLKKIWQKSGSFALMLVASLIVNKQRQRDKQLSKIITADYLDDHQKIKMLADLSGRKNKRSAHRKAKNIIRKGLVKEEAEKIKRGCNKIKPVLSILFPKSGRQQRK